MWWVSGFLLLRAAFFALTDANVVQEGVDPFVPGMVSTGCYIAAAAAVAAALIYFVIGRERIELVWEMGKGLVAPVVVMSIMLGAIVSVEVPTMGINLMTAIFVDWIGVATLILPVFLPIVLKLPVQEIGFLGTLDPKHVAIWFGGVFCMNRLVSFLPAAFGPAAFCLKSVAPARITRTDTVKGFLPCTAIQLIALTVVWVWPPIVALFA